MLKLDEYVSRLRATMTTDHLQGKVVLMEIPGEGFIRIDGTEVSAEAGENDCHLTASHEVFDKIFHGRIDPAIAFGTGDLRMDGDMSAALLLGPVFEQARG